MSSPTAPARVAIRFVLAFGLMLAAFFVPAGTLVWPEAWLFLVIQLGWAAVLFAWLARNNPALMVDRMQFMKSTAVGWDKVYIIVSAIAFIPMLLLPGLDAVRFGWSQMPVVLEALGFALFILSLLGIFWTMRANTFLSRVVEIQSGHHVITTGPYAIVRHPMYASMLLLFAGLPLALGSYWTLVPALLQAVMLALRTRAEDRMLHVELPGYAEYAQKVRWRLVPGLW